MKTKEQLKIEALELETVELEKDLAEIVSKLRNSTGLGFTAIEGLKSNCARLKRKIKSNNRGVQIARENIELTKTK